jgi:NAD(P)-dependent dehydrogenase (short-subunit alcohol dehydrogenase family)
MHPISPASNVLITGAARRLGRAMALAFARDGWNIAVHYPHARDDALETAERVQALGRRCALVQGDLTKDADTARVFDESLNGLGALDAVVNNASVFEYDDALSASGDTLRAHAALNLIAPVRLSQLLFRHITRRPANTQGVVVNLLDQKLWNPNPDFFSYTLSKAGLRAATIMLAQALAPAVRVVGVAPGLTLPSHLQSAEAFAKTHAMSPLGRSSSPADVAQAALFAAKNSSMTGTTLIVDGGQHLTRLPRDFSMME